MELISGKELSATRKAEMAEEVKGHVARYGRAPQLTVVLVGEDPAFYVCNQWNSGFISTWNY